MLQACPLTGLPCADETEDDPASATDTDILNGYRPWQPNRRVQQYIEELEEDPELHEKQFSKYMAAAGISGGDL
jgi:hypothetical protein